MTRKSPPPVPDWAAALGFGPREFAAASAWADEQLAAAPPLSARQCDRIRAIFAATRQT